MQEGGSRRESGEMAATGPQQASGAQDEDFSNLIYLYFTTVNIIRSQSRFHQPMKIVNLLLLESQIFS